MKKTLILASAIAVTGVLMVQPALAGDRTMSKSNGSKASIHCTGSGCVTKFYSKSGKLTRTQRGEGGRYNFKKIVRRLAGQGYH